MAVYDGYLFLLKIIMATKLDFLFSTWIGIPICKLMKCGKLKALVMAITNDSNFCRFSFFINIYTVSPWFFLFLYRIAVPPCYITCLGNLELVIHPTSPSSTVSCISSLHFMLQICGETFGKWSTSYPFDFLYPASLLDSIYIVRIDNIIY